MVSWIDFHSSCGRIITQAIGQIFNTWGFLQALGLIFTQILRRILMLALGLSLGFLLEFQGSSLGYTLGLLQGFSLDPLLGPRVLGRIFHTGSQNWNYFSLGFLLESGNDFQSGTCLGLWTAFHLACMAFLAGSSIRYLLHFEEISPLGFLADNSFMVLGRFPKLAQDLRFLGWKRRSLRYLHWFSKELSFRF
jgi:hypothetical protein